MARDIKLSHTVFALPFALLATFLAADAQGRLPGTAVIALIVVCMVLARTVAMTMNRWMDARLDGANPRTAGRAIPSERVSRPFMLTVAICASGAFVASTAGFWILSSNHWPLLLGPLVLAWLVGYSATKRFTWLCHLFLGASLALSPLAAAIAVNPAYLAHPEPYLLAIMVACWVAGFDIFYAMQDIDVDREAGLRSIPAAFGPRAARGAAAACHLAAVASLAALAALAPALGWAFGAAAALAAALLISEHALIRAAGTRHMQLAFFTLNGIVSLILAAAGILDVVRNVWNSS